jgi:hypothetical protein
MILFLSSNLSRRNGRLAAKAQWRRVADQLRPKLLGPARVVFTPGDLNELQTLNRESEALVASMGGFDFLINYAAIDPVAPHGVIVAAGVTSSSP